MHMLVPGLPMLDKPILDLNMTKIDPDLTEIKYVAALPGGEAAMIINYRRVVQINKQGQLVRELYKCLSCSKFHGLLVLGGNLTVLQQNGTVSVIRIHDGQLLQVYYIPDVGAIYYFGSLYWDPDAIDPDVLFLTDWYKGEVFSYRFSTLRKEVLVKNLSHPFSASYFFNKNETFYIICQRERHYLSVYNATWNRVRTIAHVLTYPHAAIVSPDNTVIVADTNNNRVSEFNIDGEFIRNVITIPFPNSLSFSYPHLWVVENWHRLYKYKLYETLINLKE